MNWQKSIIQALIKRDGKLCKLCKGSFLEFAPPEIDHIIPRSAGGSDELENLQLAHHICNVRKGSNGQGRKRGKIPLLNKPLPTTRDIYNEVDRYMAKELEQALVDHAGVQKHAAESLGMHYRSFRHYMLKFGILYRF